MGYLYHLPHEWHKAKALGTIYLHSCKIIGDTVRTLADDIPTRNLSTLQVAIVSRPCDKLQIIL